jgi:hypothetical protein
MSAGSANAKICVICQCNCAGKPRTKDPKGRYYCQPCYDEAQQAVNRVEKTVSESVPCQSCGVPMDAQAIICMACGYNVQTGQSVVVNQQESPEHSGRVQLEKPVIISLAILGIFVILAGLAFVEPLFALIHLIGVVVLGVSVMVRCLIVAFTTSLLQGFLSLLVPFYYIWFIYGVSKNSLLKWGFGVMLIGAMLFGAIMPFI